MASLVVRVPFVAALAAFAGGVRLVVVPLSRCAPRGSDARGALAAIGGLACAMTWWADERVLPRLYPAFHVAMVLTLGSGALVGLAVRAEPPSGSRPRRRTLVTLVAGALTMHSPPAAGSNCLLRQR